MPTFDDPMCDAEEAYQALRALAHATRTWNDPADTYPVLAALVGGVRALQQVLGQTAQAHLAHLARAHDDSGNPSVGSTSAQAAAHELQGAASLLSDVEQRVNRAWQHTGRIAWSEPVQHSTTTTAAGWDDSLDVTPALTLDEPCPSSIEP